MNLDAGRDTTLPFRKNPLLVGVAFGIVSALGYTAANICLREVAGRCDAVFVSFVRAIPIALGAAVFVAWNTAAGVRIVTSRGQLGRLVATALFMQFAGNVAFQWALGQIGLAITVPLMFGSLIIGSAILGRLFLAERLTARSSLSMFTLIAAIIVLGLASNQGGNSLGNDPSLTPFLLVGAAAAACSAGLGYASGNVVMRQAMHQGMTLSATLMIVGITGVVSLGALSYCRSGYQFPQPARGDLLTILAAGVFNAVAFSALGRSLQLLPVLHVNILNASQVAMAAICGMIIFGEPSGLGQFLGIALTLTGLMLMKGRK